MTANYINHIALVLDASGSMQHMTNEVIKVADNQIAYLAQRSKELDQETRVTIYTFDYSYNIKCVVYDKDVLRLPSLKGIYRPNGQTALIDATIKALEDLEKTAQLYGDHAFLAYVLTDGEENASRNRPDTLKNVIQSLPDNWTIAAFVPNATGKFEAKKFGFPADNIAIWDATSARGMAEAGEVIRKTTDTFMRARATGVRGSRSIFNMDDAIANLSTTVVKSKLDCLHPGQYRTLAVAPRDNGEQISTFVEEATGRAYKVGEAFYQLSKTEKVQPRKTIALYDRRTKNVYTGKHARTMLGLPDVEVRVVPAAHPEFDIFVQSTSVNRKIVGGTKILLIN